MPMRRTCCGRRRRLRRLRSLSWSSHHWKRFSSRRLGGAPMLKNTLLIAKREYLERVRSKVFRITTVLVPIGMAGMAFIGGIGTRKIEQGVENMAIVSNNAELAQQVEAALLSSQHPPQAVEMFAATPADIERANHEVE